MKKEKDFTAIFSENLKRYLEEYEMSQNELARRLHVTPTSVSGWVAGSKTPRMDKVDKIEAQLLDTVDDALKSVRIAVKARNASANKDTAEKQKAALRLKLKRVQAVYMDGGLSDAEYTARRDAISADLAAIRTEPEKVPEPLPDNWRETYDGLDPEHRRRFWQTVLRAITVNADRSISLTFC